MLSVDFLKTSTTKNDMHLMKFMVGTTTYDLEQTLVKLVITQPNNNSPCFKRGGRGGGNIFRFLCWEVP
jgi:hypothetical protein